MKFVIQNSVKNEKEAKTVAFYCITNNIKYRISKEKDDFIQEDEIPIGYIKWFEKVSHLTINKPEYYPEFLQPLFGRKIWYTEKWPIGTKVFIKPADQAKRFTGFVTSGTYKGKKRGPFWCSDIINFINEWRYYITNGKILTAKWYSGINDDEIPPEFPNIKIPKSWCGSIDLGKTQDNKILLVESSLPYSTGWYGQIGDPIYSEWLIDGYKWMKEVFR